MIEDNGGTALDDLANEIMARLAPGDGYQDDVAMLLYRQPAPLEMEFPPMSESSRPAGPPCAGG